MRAGSLALSLAALLLGAAPALARPAHKQALAEYFGPYLPKKLHDCRTCHLPDPPDFKEGDEKPQNAFGERLVAVKQELRKAGKKTTIADRLEAILDEDSDGDGVSNLLEILAGRYPGDPSDRPTDAELAAAKKTVALWKKYRQSYPWRPYEAVKRPAVPAVKNAAWVKTPIDAFIVAEHERVGLTPRPEAPKAVLLRRVYLDLIGLPPTPAELHAFLADTSADAYEKVVDRLLNDPRYGERWGRHWMDIWRYSDWAGYGAEVRDSHPHVWRWRDWIVASLNSDKGYDRMILEMLAGDELAPEDASIVAATGYLVRNWKRYSREKWMQDTVEHTFQAFLGTTLGCARCHDHLYDPITQKEYYQVRAVFDPLNIRMDRVPGQADVNKDGMTRVFDEKLDAKTFLFLRGDDRTPHKTPLAPGVPEGLGGGTLAVKPVALPRAAWAPDNRGFVVQETLAASAETVKTAERVWQTVYLQAYAASALATQPRAEARAGAMLGHLVLQNSLRWATLELAAARAKHEALVAVVAVEALEEAGKRDGAVWKEMATLTVKLQRQAAVAEAQRAKATAQLMLATLAPNDAPKRATAQMALAAAEKQLAQAEAAMKAAPSTAYTPRAAKTYATTSTGRRLALARWIADKDNPLTARVAVNHLWARHFGQGLVPTVADFGRNGRLPSHPALLDWLAAEFMERGWSMKAIHKLIVTSNAYRMASNPDVANAALDADNKYLWRFAPRRLEAEAVRDSVFYVAGKLDSAIGGPDIPEAQGLTVPRRSLYFRHAAEKQMEFLALFEGASVTECYERKHAIVPQQALALMNSDVVRKHSRLLARSLAKGGGGAAAFTAAAFEAVLSRAPTVEELAECTAFLANQEMAFQGTKAPPAAADGSTPSPDPALRARENLVHVLMNHHEFVTIR
jgi:hypothetical protein